MKIKLKRNKVKLDTDGNVVGSTTEEFMEQDILPNPSAEDLINEIHKLPSQVAYLSDSLRKNQEAAVGFVREGNFTSAVSQAQEAAHNLRLAKELEVKAARLLDQLISQMHSEGYAESIIFGVLETLIVNF